MAVHILVNDFMGNYVRYDDESDVLFATYKGFSEPTKWRAAGRTPDLLIGLDPQMEEVCVDFYADEYEVQLVDNQVALSLNRARSHGWWGFEETLILNMGRNIDLGLLNIMRKGQEKLQQLPKKSKPSILSKIINFLG